jgi:regulator of protease activity HflC (stomatin/prohibitin superfamily)
MLSGNFIISTFDWILEKWKDYLSPVVILRCYEGGVLLRLGTYKRELHEGWNWKIPFIDEVHTVIKTVDTFHVSAVDITTTDGKQVSVEPIIKFDIIEFKKYLVDTNQASDNLHDIARGVIADYLTDCDWEGIKKKTTLTQIKNKLKNECDDMGVTILKVYFGRIVTTKMFTVFKE